jgi:hypothetical protein
MRGTNRTYYLIRLHDGEASVVASGASTVLAAKTDRFSPYVLAFKEPSANPGKQSKDPVKRQEPASPESPAPAANRVVSTPVSSSKDSSGNASNRTVTTTQQSKSTATSLPRTGDSMFEHSVLLLAASCIIAVAVRLKCQKGSRPV